MFGANLVKVGSVVWTLATDIQTFSKNRLKGRWGGNQRTFLKMDVSNENSNSIFHDHNTFSILLVIYHVCEEVKAIIINYSLCYSRYRAMQHIFLFYCYLKPVLFVLPIDIKVVSLFTNGLD